MDKTLIVDKPKGFTSHDIVKFYRKKLGIRKIGHAGTLDPFATGVLILLVGQATKKFASFSKLDKEYQIMVELGWSTDTGDIEGIVVKKLSQLTIKELEIKREDVIKVLKSFVGQYQQQVPKYSAVKFKGKPLYKYAREGKKVKLPKKKVEIKKIKLLDYNFPRLKIKVVCSSGTYMRSLAVDIGKKLNLPAVAIELRRTRIGRYSI